jgi:hypothetical protein
VIIVVIIYRQKNETTKNQILKFSVVVATENFMDLLQVGPVITKNAAVAERLSTSTTLTDIA